MSRRRTDVPFAGYDMRSISEEPSTSTITCPQAGLFEVSHMGQAFLVGAERAVGARARGAGAPISSSEPGRQRYTQYTDATGGIPMT